MVLFHYHVFCSLYAFQLCTVVSPSKPALKAHDASPYLRLSHSIYYLLMYLSILFPNLLIMYMYEHTYLLLHNVALLIS